MRTSVLTRLIVAGAFVFCQAAIDAGVSVAQTARPVVTGSVGLIRNVRTNYHGKRYSLYPEIQLSGPLLAVGEGPVSLDGSVYLGGWMDTGEPYHRPLCGSIGPCWDQLLVESYSSLLFGFRVALAGSTSRAAVAPFFGIARQLIWYRVEDKNAPELDHHSTSHHNTFETGIRLHFRVSDRILLGFGVQRYWDLTESEYDVSGRYAYAFTIGHAAGGRGAAHPK